MNKMIFEGQVDESEVGKLVNGSNIEVSIGAIEDKKFPAKLTFIAPKGSAQNGAVQFKIKANISLDDKNFIRAGYSANAGIVLEKKDSVLAIREALLRFDRKTEKPYVEIKKSEGKFEKKIIELGISDGENVEILKGITLDDKIKVWNKATKDKAKKSK
jgi:HlyD family secretion protein